MPKFRVKLIWSAAFVLLSAACASHDGPAVRVQSAAPPNIILIVADDLGYGDISVNGSQIIPTPNIDALAASGTNFTNGHVTAAVCAPSRAALLTGRQQQRFGYEFNPRGRDRTGIGLPQSERALPSYLQARGYRTALIGKWHLGRTRETHPLSHGFDEFFGFTAGGTGYLVEPGHGDDWIQNQVEGSRVGFQPMELERGYEPASVTSGYQTDILTDEAVSFIERNRDQPFFLTLAYHAPHTPLQANAHYLSRFAHIEDRATRIYAAMVSALDDGVGRVIETLQRNRLSENTLVVFLSDNGCAAYIGIGVCSNAPFAGYKGTYFEGGVRVPMIAAWPGTWPRGRNFEGLVSSVDLTATMLAAAGADTTGVVLDGVDLSPQIANSSGAGRSRIYWRTSPNYAMTDGDWKLVVMKRSDGQGMVTLLFNLAQDPGETRDLASQHPEIVARLSAEFARWSQSIPTPAFESQREGAFDLPNGVRVNVYN